MNRVGLLILTVVLQACASASDQTTVAAVTSYSADAYATCAACHLEDGAGIPGAFPPLRNRIAAIAGLEGGPEYLVTVVSFGLMGQIDAGGSQYFGVMAGNSGSMSVREIAAALNYALFELVDEDMNTAGINPITAAQVSLLQSETTANSPAVAASLRREMVTRHKEEWPE
jgi:mono/diheme cytochrome c family protein